MKKIQLLFFLLSISLGLLAQNQAFQKCETQKGLSVFNPEQIMIQDFTIVDSEGVTHNFYETLGQGKTVFIDLFFVTCSWCQTYAPIIEQIYENTGSGMGDVVFWGISDRDNNASINTYKTQYGVSNPCAGTQGGGLAAHNKVIAGQNFLGWPTYVVVCPDGTVYFDPCYPPTVTGFNQYFNNCAATTLNANFDADITSLCGPGDVSFTDESAGNIVSWLWTFAGGNPSSSTVQNPTVSYTETGVYDVSLTVSNGTNTNTETKSAYINLNPIPQVTFSELPDLCVYNPSYALTEGNPQGGVYSGNGVFMGSFYPQAAGTGTHTITYTYTDLNNCENSAQQDILVDECTSVKEFADQDVLVFPNPSSSGIFEVRSSLFYGNFNIEIYSYMGIEMDAPQFRTDQGFKIDLTRFSKGVYAVIISGDHNSMVVPIFYR